MERIFKYKGYEISEFPFDYSREKRDRWQAHNTNDCDEVMIVSETFEDALDEIDYRLSDGFLVSTENES
jgi:hypothetical protein